MAWVIPNSTSQAGTVAPLGANDLFVASNVSIASTGSAPAVTGTGGNEIIVRGTVTNESQECIKISALPTASSGVKITVHESGEVASLAGGAAIAINGYGSEIVNEGLLWTHIGYGIGLFGENPGATSTITNSGTIESARETIIRNFSSSSETIVLNNSGLIQGGDGSFGIEGYEAPGRDIINNTGMMIGAIRLDAGADVYNGATGRLTGGVYGRGGNDDITTGIDNDFIDGGVGADTMRGGNGNDTYMVDSSADKVIELANQGVDTVWSSITFALSATVEKLNLIAAGNLNGYGNAVANEIYGSDLGNNILNGLGGDDQIHGLEGNDTLIGETGNDILKGYAGQDKLYGNAGNDTLTGDAGVDYFIFNTTPNYTTNRDFLTDFVHGGDKFWMENAVFTKLGAAGALNPNFFRLGPTALEADDYLVYNNTTGNLYYDSNGNGAGAAVLFATLTSKPILSAPDFVVI
jgi:serralysin